MADNDSKSARYWIELLDHYQPALQARITQAVSQWNLIVRDHLRSETALRQTLDSFVRYAFHVAQFHHPLSKQSQCPTTAPFSGASPQTNANR